MTKGPFSMIRCTCFFLSFILVLFAAGIGRAEMKKKLSVNGSNKYADQFREETQRYSACFIIVPLKDAEWIATVEEHYQFGGTIGVSVTVKTPEDQLVWEDHMTSRIGHLKTGKDLADRFVKQMCNRTASP